MEKKNVYKIREDDSLFFVLPKKVINANNITKDKKITIVVNLYYEEQVGLFIDYVCRIPEYVNVLLISSKQSIILELRERFKDFTNYHLIHKDNKGRDISALLIEAKDYVLDSDYVCFLHDKKEHLLPSREKETGFWLHNILENTISSNEYIQNVINVFEENREIGVLTIPEPIGKNFYAWEGNGWNGSFEATQQLAKILRLECHLDELYPPISLGSAFWLKTEAVKKIFYHGWTYSDFEDEKLNDDNYISYAVERIFPYVAQDAGYKTGEVMTAEYAGEFINRSQQISHSYAGIIDSLFKLKTAERCDILLSNYERIIKKIHNVQSIYLYGAGNYGGMCLRLLRMFKYDAKAFVVSNESEKKYIEGVPVLCINDFEVLDEEYIFIITVFDELDKNAIEDTLTQKHFKYISLWG